MSFGFSVGDFLGAITLANKIRKEFVGAPAQFKALSDDVKNLSFALQDVDTFVSTLELSDQQKQGLDTIDQGCRNVLEELQEILDKNTVLGSDVAGGARGRMRRAWKRLNWKPEEVDELRSRINTNIGFLTGFDGRLMRDNVVKLVQHRDDEESRKIFDWITTIDYAPQQNDFLARREGATGQWLVDSAEFKSWSETNGQTLFCPGIPGAGKTILTSIVVNNLNARFHDDKSVGIAYLYCNFKRQEVQTTCNLLASILKQLAESHRTLSDAAKDLYNRHKSRRTAPSLGEYIEAIKSVAALFSKVFIVVDALDECQESCRAQLLTKLFEIQTSCGINLFATSRPIQEIATKFKDGISLEIRASKEDIGRYLEARMEQTVPLNGWSHQLQDEIKAVISEAVDGMFLLAQIYFTILDNKITARDVRTALAQLKRNSSGSGEEQRREVLEKAYVDIMERINGQKECLQQLATSVLMWITCAMRPLTTLELQNALATVAGDSTLDEDNIVPVQRIITVCAGLVTVGEESGVIRLVHYTAQEYMERTKRHWFPNAEVEITQTCVTFLQFDFPGYEFNVRNEDDLLMNAILPSLPEVKPFFRYAGEYWGHHARNVLTLSQILSQAAIAFLTDGGKVYRSVIHGIRLVKYLLVFICGERGKYSNTIGLRLAALLGVEVFVRLLLDKGGFEVDGEDGDSRTPLYWAAVGRNNAVVNLLLEKGARVEYIPLAIGRSPLNWAVIYECKALIQHLLDAGADVNAECETGHANTLEIAVSKGDIEIVTWLLKANADVRARDHNGFTALHYAAARGQESVVKLLLESDVEIDSRSNIGRTALHIAAWKGHIAVLKQLIEANADIEARCSDGLTPLHLAAETMQKSAFELLFKAQIEAKISVGDELTDQVTEVAHQDLDEMMLSMKEKVVQKFACKGMSL